MPAAEGTWVAGKGARGGGVVVLIDKDEDDVWLERGETDELFQSRHYVTLGNMCL